MTQTYKIAVFHGDGIGPEIMAPTLDILTGLAAASDAYDLTFQDAPAGAAHYARRGCDPVVRHGPARHPL